MLDTNSNLIVGVLGGVAAIIGAAKWVADAFKEHRLAKEIKLIEIIEELDMEKAHNKRIDKELQTLKNDMSLMKIRMAAVLPLLKKMNAGDPETIELLELLTISPNVTPAS
jgi:hypothetical protein